MKQEIINALKNSLIGDNYILQESNIKLSQFAKKEGYCMSLMQIVDQPNFQIPLKQSSLIQLKNTIKQKWKSKNNEMQLSLLQKNNIKNAIILAIIRCQKNQNLIKLYRQILITILKYEYQKWIPLNQILTYLQKNQKIQLIFHCIIAICTNFQFSIFQTQKNIFYHFLKSTLPLVLINVKNNISNSQIIYLSLKILWKSIHYDINDQIKILTNNWMELLLFIITAKNQNLQKNFEQIQPKNTPEFFYFHSKKWATRTIFRFIKKHAAIYDHGILSTSNVQYSKYWYQNYGIKMLQVIISHLVTDTITTKKIRYFQLKIIQGIIEHKPQLILHYSKQFQFDILLKYLFVTRQDEKYAKEDLIEYLRNQQDIGTCFNNLKRAAMEIWNCFMETGSKQDNANNIYFPGPLFQESIQFMINKMSSNNLLEKQLGMYILYQNRTTIMKVQAIKQKIPQIIQQYIVPQLSSSVPLLRVRANDILSQYGGQIKNINLSKKAIEGVFKCLTQQQSKLVKIKAAVALNSITPNQQSKKLLQPYLQNILQTYLKLIQQYDLQKLIYSLQCFIGDFSSNIGPFAVDLFRYLSDIFIKMFNKQSQQNEEGNWTELQLSISRSIKAMTQIIESPLNQQTRIQLQPYVLKVFTFLFINQSLDYTEELMYMMRVYIQKIHTITPPSWFFYQVIIYFVVGIPNELWNQMTNLPLPEQDKKILASVRNGTNIEMLQYVVPILRNYFSKCQDMILPQSEEFKRNIVYLVFYLVGFIYKQMPEGSIEDDIGELHFDCSSILLVYLYENFRSELTKDTIQSTWGVIKYNISRGKSSYLKQITCQLICMLLWKHSLQFIEILLKQRKLILIIKYIKEIYNNLQQSYQIKRVILGLCSYFNIIHQNEQLLKKNSQILFKILIKLIKKNCKKRILYSTNKQNIKQIIMEIDDNDSDSDHSIQYNNAFDDNDDLWDQQYNQNNASLLKNVNQLTFFKSTMEKMNTQTSLLYQQIISTVPSQKLLKLQEILNKAINLPDK